MKRLSILAVFMLISVITFAQQALWGSQNIILKQEKAACASFAKAKELGDPNVDELIKKHCK